MQIYGLKCYLKGFERKENRVCNYLLLIDKTINTNTVLNN